MTPTKLVVLIVGTALLAGLAGIIVLAAQDRTVPDVLQNVTIGSLTLLGGLLVPRDHDLRNDPPAG